MNSPKLSILVITHNQRELLKRCLDSVLGQKLNVPFEVIVSDDRSDDGTAEYMADLQDQITNDKRQITNLTQLIYTRCNSNDCNPANVSERCGWNKLNVYNHARGEYFVNIDADDYLKSNDIYQAQLDMLEMHPECSMCMQDVWRVYDGEPLNSGQAWPSDGKFESGYIFSKLSSISSSRALNQCYMTRRHPKDNMMALYGKYFDDTIITFHHLQYGPVVFIDRADYVWVKYPTSITSTLTGDDDLVTHALLPLHHIRFIPSLFDVFMEDGIQSLVHLFKELSKKQYHLCLSDRTLIEYRETQGYIYEALCREKPTSWDQIKLRYIRLILLLTLKFKLHTEKYIYKLLIK